MTCLGALALSTIAFLYQGGSGVQTSQGSVNLASFTPLVADNEVWLYEHPSYQGRSVVLKTGEKINLVDMNFDRITSSFKLGSKVRVKFCHHKDCANPRELAVSELVGPFN